MAYLAKKKGEECRCSCFEMCCRPSFSEVYVQQIQRFNLPVSRSYRVELCFDSWSLLVTPLLP